MPAKQGNGWLVVPVNALLHDAVSCVYYGYSAGVAITGRLTPFRLQYLTVARKGYHAKTRRRKGRKKVRERQGEYSKVVLFVLADMGTPVRKTSGVFAAWRDNFLCTTND